MRPTLTRTLGTALAGVLLAVPASAWGAKPDDAVPQANAKKEVTTEAAPGPAAQAEPAPTEPIKPVKVEGSKPVTTGTAKKLPATTTPAAAAPSSSGSTTATRSRRSTRTSSGTGTRRSATRGNRGGATRGTARAEQVQRLNDEARAEREAEQAAAARRGAKRRAAQGASTAAPAPPEDDSGAHSSFVLSRAAEDVVEVIPGAVLLAMTGMAALVLLLIGRSWAYERRRTRALRDSYSATVQALAVAIEAKDHTTGGHIERVRELGLLLARELGVKDVDDPQMAYGFLLHDIGKLSVPDAILRHPGRLDADAWTLMRRHPEEGVRILGAIPFLDRALDVVRHHHERWDGTGYPAGLAGEEIPQWARIFSVVDALDAMTAERPYRAALPYEDALAEIQRHAGTQFDPEVVQALARVEPERVHRFLEPAQHHLEAPVMPTNGNGVPVAELGELGELDPQAVSA